MRWIGDPQGKLLSGAFFLVRSLYAQRMNTAEKTAVMLFFHQPKLCHNDMLIK
ncbi:phosphatidylserine decarboxylase [Mariprofundus ferrooxydans]|uniref:Phosphatidylserine decarboxylase n=1 Tax=Mariprofundus ferrooxydans PV-1 TaxID=314345 RepID=Q0F217_9PROT|nr:phosphatidylserine decarboxylase [Mariprofundus ferrooxydans PV-1]KON47891.1 phosphatidylserine decarboxylase [Mariprofundus ferrooxydans]